MAIKVMFAVFLHLHIVLSANLCSSSLQTASVIDICSSRTVVEDSFSKNILLQVTTTKECQCTLSIREHIQPINVVFKMYDGDSSSLSNNNCGVNLLFESINGILGPYHCDTHSSILVLPPSSDVQIYTTATPTVNVTENQGFCLELIIDSSQNYNSNVKLELTCNNSLESTSVKVTSSPITTTMLQGTSNAKSSLRLFIAIGAILGGVLVVLTIIVAVWVKRRWDKTTDTILDYVNSTPMPLYDDLLVPTIDNIATSYTTLQPPRGIPT